MTEITGRSNVKEFTVITNRMSMKDKSSLSKNQNLTAKSFSKNLPELEKEK